MTCLTHKNISAYDDFLTNVFIDSVYYWDVVRKIQTNELSRKFPISDIVPLIKYYLIKSQKPSIKAFIEVFMNLKRVRRFVEKNTHGNRQLIHEFERHASKYCQIYLKDTKFEISTTDRYIRRSGRSESCVIARKSIKQGEIIKYLTAILTPLDPKDADEYQHLKRDFSIIETTRTQQECLLLGPLRLVNHSCRCNARLVSTSYNTLALIAEQPIQVGEEITIFYAPNYFGKHNRECLCLYCELEGKGGHVPQSYRDDDETKDASDTDSESDDSNANEKISNPFKDEEVSDEESIPQRLLRTRKNKASSSKLGKYQTTWDVVGREPKPGEEEMPSDFKKRVYRILDSYHNTKIFTIPKNQLYECENCGQYFALIIEAEITGISRICERCLRHVKLYDFMWPATTIKKGGKEVSPISKIFKPIYRLNVQEKEVERERFPAEHMLMNVYGSDTYKTEIPVNKVFNVSYKKKTPSDPRLVQRQMGVMNRISAEPNSQIEDIETNYKKKIKEKFNTYDSDPEIMSDDDNEHDSSLNELKKAISFKLLGDDDTYTGEDTDDEREEEKYDDDDDDDEEDDDNILNSKDINTSLESDLITPFIQQSEWRNKSSEKVDPRRELLMSLISDPAPLLESSIHLQQSESSESERKSESDDALKHKALFVKDHSMEFKKMIGNNKEKTAIFLDSSSDTDLEEVIPKRNINIIEDDDISVISKPTSAQKRSLEIIQNPVQEVIGLDDDSDTSDEELSIIGTRVIRRGYDYGSVVEHADVESSDESIASPEEFVISSSEEPDNFHNEYIHINHLDEKEEEIITLSPAETRIISNKLRPRIKSDRDLPEIHLSSIKSTKPKTETKSKSEPNKKFKSDPVMPIRKAKTGYVRIKTPKYFAKRQPMLTNKPFLKHSQKNPININDRPTQKKPDNSSKDIVVLD